MTIRRQDDEPDNGSEPFLSRWSRLKRDDGREALKEEKATQAEQAAQNPLAQVPPVEKLTPESDFSAFMGPKVQDAVRRVALKKLFTDPHFNVPDPFEPFSGDWTVGEPITEEVLKTLNQARTHLFPEEKKREEAQEQERIAAGAAEPAPEDGAGESHAANTDTLEEKHDEPGRQDA